MPPTNVKKYTPPSSKGQKRREIISASAKNRLVSHGYEGLVLREIASELGITHGNLQYYFKTREDLLTEIFEAEVRQYTDSIKSSLERASTKDGKIATIVESMLTVLESEQTSLWRVLIGVADQNEGFKSILERENKFFEKTLADTLCILNNDLGIKRAMHISRAIRCLLDGLAVDLAYSSSTTQEFKAFRGEFTTLIQKLMKNELAGPT